MHQHQSRALLPHKNAVNDQTTTQKMQIDRDHHGHHLRGHHDDRYHYDLDHRQSLKFQYQTGHHRHAANYSLNALTDWNRIESTEWTVYVLSSSSAGPYGQCLQIDGVIVFLHFVLHPVLFPLFPLHFGPNYNLILLHRHTQYEHDSVDSVDSVASLHLL